MPPVHRLAQRLARSLRASATEAAPHVRHVHAFAPGVAPWETLLARQQSSLTASSSTVTLPPIVAAIFGRQALRNAARSGAVAAAVRRWNVVEARIVTLASSFFCNPAGQKLLGVGIPLIASELLRSSPSSAQCAALADAGERLPLASLEVPYALDSVSGVLHIVLEELFIALRGLYLAILFLPVIATTPLALVSDWKRERWLELVRWTLEMAGPAFIKWGQWAATRPDLFPPDLCGTLERLQAAAPSHPYHYTVQAVEQAFGNPIHELFTHFSVDPVASGSIAQVYKAVLSQMGAEGTGLKPGTLVAVKVRHPGMKVMMHRDFTLMQRAASMASRLPCVAALNLDESVRQFGGPLKEQLDLVREAKHLARFNHNFRRWTNLSFPRPIFPLVSSDVLVESFEEGALISAYVKNPGRHTRALADVGMNCYLKMLLKDNFIHADLHPGNILVRFGDAHTLLERLGQLLWRERIPHMVLLDTGMIAELSARDKENLMEFFKAVAAKNGSALGQRILMFSDHQTCPDPDEFVADMTSLMNGLTSDYITQHTSEVISQVMERVRKHQVALKGTVSTIVVTTLVLEGWSTKLNPDIRIMSSLKELLPMKWSERISQTVDNIITRNALPSTV